MLAARTIDNWLDSAIGVSIAEPVVNVVHDILPANIIHNLTGLTKPSDVEEGALMGISSKLKSMRTGGKGILPQLPRVPWD